MHGNARLTKTQLFQIKEYLGNGKSLGYCALRFGVSRTAIFKIKKGITYKGLQ